VKGDLGHAVRLLLKAPGFTALAAGALALGIAASTAIFRLADAVLLAPLPYEDPHDRVMIWSRWRGFDKTWVNPAEARAWRERCPSLADVAHWQVDRANLTGEGEALRVGAGFVSANTFAVLGARPMLGRSFTAEEDRPGGPRVVVLGHALWQGRFGGDPGVLGKAVALDGVPHEVVGVMPPGFALPTDFGEGAAEPTQLYVPRAPEADELLEFGSHGDFGAARLRPGATAARATVELRAAMEQLTAEGRYDPRQGHEAFAVPLADEILGEHRPVVATLATAALLLLLVACANVASLLLARGAGRHREMALRAAVGASRARLVRQLLVEGLVLGLAAAALGLPLARATLRGLSSALGAHLPRAAAAAIDPRAVAFALALAVFTTLAFALAPALQTARPEIAEALREGGFRARGGLSHRRWRRGIVVAQASLAALLAVGAGLMARSLEALTRIDVGFEPRGVLTARLNAPPARYREAVDVVRFYRRVVDEVRALPGVRHAGLLRVLPLGETIGDYGIDVEGYDETAHGPAQADWQVVTEGASEALGERLVRGRLLQRGDDESTPDVAVVNEAMARRYWGDQDPVGRRFRIGSAQRPWVAVVGVVGDVRHNGIAGAVKAKFYRPHAQFHRSRGGPTRDMALVLKAEGDPLALAAAVRSVARRIDADVPVSRVRTMNEVVASSIAAPRLAARVLGLFAAVAFALCAVGVYGVLAYGVAERRQEIAVRLALGARPSQVSGLVLAEGLAAVGVGLAGGLLAAAVVSRSLGSLLHEVKPVDPATYAAVALGLSAVALLAGLVPAVRATRTDPANALRQE
jgi:putative ABC transport system permease protein